MKRFEVRELREEDTDAVAGIHAQCFKGYFLTQLGRRVLGRYYAEFCRHSFDCAIVAVDQDDGNIVAFVVGTSDTQAHFRSFYRRNMTFLLPLVAVRFVTDPVVRRMMWQRMAHIKAAFRSLIPGTKRDASETISDKGPENQCPVRLLSIAAAPDYRGSGVATLVTERFEELLRSAGHKRVGLSVFADNERAIGFYRKTGWKVTYASDAGWWFEKDL